MNTPTNTIFTNRDLCLVARAPGGDIGAIMSEKNIQPLHVRITKGGTHRYTWGPDAMEWAKEWRAKKDEEIDAVKAVREAKRIRSMRESIPAPEVTELNVPNKPSKLDEVVEQLKIMNQTLSALLNIWTKE